MAVPGGLEPPTNGLGNRAPPVNASSVLALALLSIPVRHGGLKNPRLTSRCVGEISGDIISK